MLLGICELELIIYESNSLKEKRRIIKSLMGRLKSRFNISIAEVGLNENWEKSKIGLAYVSNNKKHIDKIISKILDFIDRDSRVEIIDYIIEIL